MGGVGESWGSSYFSVGWGCVRQSWGSIGVGYCWGGIGYFSDGGSGVGGYWSYGFDYWGGSYGFNSYGSWFFVDNGVETVVWVSGVLYGTFCTIRIDEGVAALDDVPTAGFLLGFAVASVGVIDGVSKIVVGWGVGFSNYGFGYWGGVGDWSSYFSVGWGSIRDSRSGVRNSWCSGVGGYWGSYFSVGWSGVRDSRSSIGGGYFGDGWSGVRVSISCWGGIGVSGSGSVGSYWSSYFGVSWGCVSDSWASALDAAVGHSWTSRV